MMLPTSRDLTIVDGDVIPGSILNRLQDCIIGLKHTAIVQPLDLSTAKVWGAGSTAPQTLSGATRYLLVTSAVADIDFPILVPPGRRLTNALVAYNREASANFGISASRWSLVGAQTVIASLVDNASAGDVTKDLAVDATAGALPYIPGATETLSLTISAATNARIYAVLVTFDNL